MFQGNLIAQDHSVRIFCFWFTVTKAKSNSILLPTPRRAEFVSFLSYPHFHKLTELFLARSLPIISINKKPDRHKILIYARRNIRLIRTPVYNGQFLKFSLLIRTPDNTDTMDTFLCPEAQTLSTLLFTGTGYLRTVYFPCHNHVLVVDILHCPNNDRFLGLSSRIAWYVWF